MKKRSLILVAVFLLSVVSSFNPLTAQEKSKEEKDVELRIQEEIDQQKKAMVEQKKAQEEMQKALEINQKEVDNALQDVRAKVQNPNNYGGEGRALFNKKDPATFSFDEPFRFSTTGTGFYGHSLSDGERSSWEFSKSVKESTYSREYIFDVGITTKTVVMSVTGDCKTGEIRISIVMPNGRTYSDIVIDDSGNLNWRKSFNITEEENKDKSGEWKYKISTSNATGFFKISLQTF